MATQPPSCLFNVEEFGIQHLHLLKCGVEVLEYLLLLGVQGTLGLFHFDLANTDPLSFEFADLHLELTQLNLRTRKFDLSLQVFGFIPGQVDVRIKESSPAVRLGEKFIMSTA